MSAREVEVGTEILSSGRIFINVGGRAAVPEMPGLEQIDYLTNSSMVDLDVLPRHLLVVGGSYIGLEFGQMYRRFGSAVTVAEMGPRLVAREDEDVSEGLAAFLTREGVDLRLNAKCISVSKRDGEIVMGLDCAEGAPEVRGSHLLLAVGRRPNTDDLGLDRAGVRRDARGYIEVDDELRTNVRASGRWAIAMGAAPSPTRPTTTMRSWRPIFSMAIDGASAIASSPMRSIPTRLLAGPG